MRKLWPVFFIIALLGCKMTLNQETKQLAFEAAARRVGYYVGKNNPQIIPSAKLIAESLIVQSEDANNIGIVKAAIVAGATQLIINDPLIRSDLKAVLSMIEVEENATNKAIALIIRSFLDGLAIAAK